MKGLQKLIEKWREKRMSLINPDGLDEWSDVGFDEPPDGYGTVTEWLEADDEGQMGAEQQVEIQVIDEILADLNELAGT